MKKNNIITVLALSLAAVSVITGCSDSKRQPGKIYMPDMAYSRALETYSLLNDTVFTGLTFAVAAPCYYTYRCQ